MHPVIAALLRETIRTAMLASYDKGYEAALGDTSIVHDPEAFKAYCEERANILNTINRSIVAGMQAAVKDIQEEQAAHAAAAEG